MKFGENLRILRLERNLSQIELSKALGVSKSIISMWENGQREPTLFYLRRLARFFKVTIDDLAGEE